MIVVFLLPILCALALEGVDANPQNSQVIYLCMLIQQLIGFLKRRMVISFIQHSTKLSSGNSFPWAMAKNQVETLKQDLSRQILPKEAENNQEHLKITGGRLP